MLFQIKFTDMKKFKSHKTFSGLFLIIGMVALFACSKNDTSSTTGGTDGPGPNEVFIQGMNFSPSSITVTAGTKITWTNKDAVAHTVTSSTGLFDSGSMPTNGTFSFTFADAGTYAYKCTFHPSMVASVTVK